MGFLFNRDAQFMLLAGFIIAIGLVVTTVMLNSIIYEQNIALGSGGESSKSDIINIILITKDEERAAYNNSTSLGGNNFQKYSNFSKQMQNFNSNLSKIYASHGDALNVNWENWTNKGYARFTENGTIEGISNWTVIENVKESTIIVNVTSGNFYVNLTNKTPDWQTLLNSSTCNPCSIDTSNVFAYKIIFLNGSNASGTFRITGNASGKSFVRARDYIVNTSIIFSSSTLKANITIPVSVPW